MNLHPIFDSLVQRTEREAFLRQRSCVLWLTGLSGSGKSTIAQRLERQLFEAGFFAQVLDGDNIRTGINANLGFGEADRLENIRRIAEVAKLFVQGGIVVITSFISPTLASRALAKSIIGPDDFLEIFINAPLEVCEQRDVKGLYAKARRGEIPDFTGIHQPYEAPENPDLEIHTDKMTVEEAVKKIQAFIRPRIEIQ